MKWLALCIISATLMVNGQESKPHTDAHKRDTTAQSEKPSDTAGQTVIVVNQEASEREQNNHAYKPPNYFSRLFAPENLPNIALFVVGGVGVVIAIGTLKVLKRQAVSMRRQTKLLRRSAKTMEGQLAAMQGQIAQTTQLLEIENKTLTLQYRPKITVRNARALNSSYDMGKPWEFEIRFQIVNKGGSPAHITAGSNIQLWSAIGHDVGQIEFNKGDEIPVSPVTLGPGQGITVEESLPAGVLFSIEWENFNQGLKTKPLLFLTLVGVIYYTDDLNIPRSTGINRAFDPKTREFVPRQEHEQEYSD